MAKVISVTQENYDKEVVRSEKPVLIDFWASWCGPCRMVAPILEQIAGEMEDDIKVVKVNVDEQPALASAFSVRSIPTLVVMKNNVKLAQMVGAQPKQALVAGIKKAIA
jgi:thioredoxin 1